MYTRMLALSQKSFFLFGPRGTGKSTWVKHQLKDAVYIDLLDAEVFNTLVSYPNRLTQYVPAGFDGWIIIDEIQRIPEGLSDGAGNHAVRRSPGDEARRLD
jgi:predicted AAA+ superfamily ATPase